MSYGTRLMTNLITNCLEILPAALADFKILEKYHYQTDPVNPATQIYKIRGINSTQDTFPDPMAVIVYRQPLPSLRARTMATKGYFSQAPTIAGRLRIVNQKIIYIARLIVDPRFRKLGLATWLLDDTLQRQAHPLVETLTPIDFTNKIFQRAGFKLYQMPAPPWYQRFEDILLSLGINEQNLKIPFLVQNRIDRLKSDQYDHVDNEIRQFLHHFRHRRNMPAGIKRTKYFLSKMPFPQAYLLWTNPRVPRYDEK